MLLINWSSSKQIFAGLDDILEFRDCVVCMGGGGGGGGGRWLFRQRGRSILFAINKTKDR